MTHEEIIERVLRNAKSHKYDTALGRAMADEAAREAQDDERKAN